MTEWKCRCIHCGKEFTVKTTLPEKVCNTCLYPCVTDQLKKEGN